MQEDMQDMKEDISDLKYTLLNPENGVIVNSNKNTEYRLELQENEKEFRDQMAQIQAIKKWKDGVNKALWIIFGSLVAIIIRMLMMHSENL